MADFPFRPMTLSDRGLVEGYRTRSAIEVSELTFTNLFAWRRAKAVYVAEQNGVLLIARVAHGMAWMLPPLGQCDWAEPVPRVLGSKCDGMEIVGMERAPEALAETLRKAGLNVEHDRDNSDYVYCREDLAELKGNKYRKKRNQVHSTLADYRCEYEEIHGPVLDECRAFQDHWCETKQCGRVPGLCQEYRAIMETLDHFDDLGLIGGAIRVEGKIRAFTIGEELLPDTAVVHFEKADITVPGLSQVINYWFCQKSLGRFEFVNREQDLGIPGLRKAKESYHPHHMVEKYRITLPGRKPIIVEEEPAPCARSMGSPAIFHAF
ncbi:MAG: phosphatidylglycerol lysyltransferase domain-containing protein [Planctomycetota bacterium]